MSDMSTGYSIVEMRDAEILYPGSIYAVHVDAVSSVASDLFRGYAMAGDSPIGDVTSVAAMVVVGRQTRMMIAVERSATAREVRQVIGLAAFWIGARPSNVRIGAVRTMAGQPATVPTVSSVVSASIGNAAVGVAGGALGAVGAAGAGLAPLLPENPIPDLKWTAIAIAASVVGGLVLLIFLLARFGR